MNSAIENLNRLGEYFLNFAWPMLWQSSLLIALIFAVDLSLTRRIRATVRHALWLVVLVKLLLPPTLALPTGAAWWLFPAKPAVKTPAQRNYVVTHENATPSPAFAQAPVPITIPFAEPPPPKLDGAGWSLLGTCSLSAALFVWLLCRWWQLAHKVRVASIPEKFGEILEHARCRAGLPPGIRLKLVEGTMSPAVCGLFRPVILLPQMLAEKLSAEQLRAVLLHEAIHIHRMDIWVNCAQALLQVAYWWHPLVWVANARIRRVREEAVDDAVVVALDADAEIYAPTLLEVARLTLERPLLSLGLVGILESRSALRQRIERLLVFRAPRKAGLTFASLCGICVFSAVALPMGEGPARVEKNMAADASPPLRAMTPPAAVSHTNPLVWTGPGRQAIMAKLDKIRLGNVSYDGLPLNEVLKQLSGQCKLLDPDHKGINFLINNHPDVSSFIIKIPSLTDVRLAEVLDAIVHGAERPIQYSVMDFAVVFSAKDRKEAQYVSGREKITVKLDHIHFARVSFDALSLKEVARQLTEATMPYDPAKVGIHFLIATNSVLSQWDEINSVVVKLPSLTDVRLANVLDAIVEVANQPIRYSIQEDGVVFVAKSAGDRRLFMRTFRVDPKTFYSGLENFGNLHLGGAQSGTGSVVHDFAGRKETNNITDPSTLVRSFFATLGVNFSNSPGKSVFFNERLGYLFVKATEDDLDTIERALQVLNQTPPQVHLKARFIEVPQGTKNQLGIDWYLGQFGLISDTVGLTNATLSILTNPKFQAILQALQSRAGVQTLGEPEITTLSGRQTQMKASTVRSCIGDFPPYHMNYIGDFPPYHNGDPIHEGHDGLDATP